jgi:type II secretory pathway component GspD/PulD (secretin)
MNNRSARIRKGEKLYYFEEFNVQSLNKGDAGTSELLVPKGKPTNLQLGITFDVAVSIGNDMQTVMMGLKPEIITFMKWEDYTSSKNETVDKVTREYITSVRLPRTHEQGVATAVAIKSGETVVLGGMVENSHSQEIWKVPFLGDIPYIGALFRRTRVENIPTNLLIFVTATIINEKGEYVRYVPPVEVSAKDLLPLEPVKEGDVAKTAPQPEAKTDTPEA